MATKAIAVSMTQLTPGANRSADAQATVGAMSVTATEAAVAVLEADGASPTQAHVTSLRSAWNTLSAAVTASKAAVPAVDVQVIFSTSLSRNQLRVALDAAYKAIVTGSSDLSS